MVLQLMVTNMSVENGIRTGKVARRDQNCSISNDHNVFLLLPIGKPLVPDFHLGGATTLLRILNFSRILGIAQNVEWLNIVGVCSGTLEK